MRGREEAVREEEDGVFDEVTMRFSGFLVSMGLCYHQ